MHLISLAARPSLETIGLRPLGSSRIAPWATLTVTNI